MTREEAIQVINEHIVHWKHLKVNGCAEPSEAKRTLEAFEMAINALQTEPCEIHLTCTDEEIAKSFIEDVEAVKDQLEKQPCEDCISRQAAIDTAIEAADKWDGGFSVERSRIITEALNELPSVQPMQKTGKWIKKIVRGRVELYCSNCGGGIDVIYEYEYCPNCGCRMEEGE